MELARSHCCGLCRRHISCATNSISLFVDDTDETNVPFKVQHTDGTWLTNTSVSTSWSSPASGHGRNSGSKIDDNGLGEICPRQTGMWSLSVKYLTPALGSRTTPLRSQPSYAGERQVAISRLSTRRAPLQFAAERVPTATIVATVEDEDGQRIAGAISLDAGRYNNGFMGHESRFASTDSRGSVSFTRVQAGTHKLRAMIPGLSVATARLDAPDSDFANEFAVPAAVIEVATGEKQTVDLRTCQVAYIRGKITPAPPQDAVLYFGLEDNWTLQPFETNCLRSPESGEFIVGPILPGKHTVGIREYKGNKEVASIRHEFDVKKAGVHREDIPYKPTPTDDLRAAVSEIGGVVLRADGQTPAYAARVAYFAPGSAVWHAGAWSDARGKFKLHPQSYRMNYAGEVTDPDGSPPHPAIVAWLPGELGAAVLPLPTDVASREPVDLKLILPERASIQGVVTIEGQIMRGLPATITVLARHRGLGKLDPVMSVLATANTDGSYEVRGLTPGSYELQAAIDGIWLSRPRALVVPDGRAWTTKVDFDFQPIGDTAKYLLVDDSGNPLPNRTVRLLGPEFSGPLAQALRTDEVRTDARGLTLLGRTCSGKSQAAC